MSTLIGALKVALSLDSAQFETGAKRARQSASTTAQSINKSLGAIKGVGQGFVAGFAIGALKNATMRALEYAGSLGELAQQLGVTSKDLQVFKFAAGQVGVTNEQLEVGLQKLTITLGKVAAGAEAPAKALEAIGLSAKDVAGLDAGAAFRKIADGLAPITDRAQRAAVEVALFGKSGANLDNLLSGGSKAINELGAAAQKLGIILSDEQIQSADATADKLRAVKTVLEAQIAGIVVQNASSILSLASSLATLTAEIGKFLNSNPQLALAIVGGLAGLRTGGPIGGAIGVVAGLYTGGRMRSNMDSGSTDTRYLSSRLKSENDILQSFVKVNKNGGALNLGPQYKKVVALTKQLEAATALTKKQGAAAGIDIPKFLSSGGGGGGGARAARVARAPKDFSARYDEVFEQDQLRNQKEILAAQRDLAINTDERAKISLQIIQIEHDEEASKIAFARSQHKLTDAQATKLNLQNDTLAALKREVVAQEVAAQKSQDEQMLAATSYDIKRASLQAQSSLATTADQRRKIELQLLDLAYEEQKARLEVIAANTQLSDAVREQARMQLAAQPGQKALDRQGVTQSTQGPLEAYKNSLPDTAAKMDEALQGVAVHGLQSLENGILSVIDGTKSLAGAFSDMAKSIIADLIRIQIQKMISGFLSKIAGGIGGGGSFDLGDSQSAVAGLDTSSFAPSFTPLGFATGGSFSIMGKPGRDQNIMSLNGLPIAKVSHGERVNVGNDNAPSGGNMTFHAPITVNGDLMNPRRTGMQLAAGMRDEMNRATRKGA